MASEPEQISMVERGEDAVPDKADNTSLEWRGLPKFVPKEKRISLILAFESEESRDELLKQLAELGGVRKVPLAKKTGGAWSALWPPQKQEDLAALRFDFSE